MNASFLRNGNKAYHHINTIRHSISDSIGIPIHRSHVRQQLQPSKAFYSRFHGRRTKDMEFSVPVRSFCSKPNSAKVSASIANSGAIGWYLGMINARPILTKSVTSAIIYTAADVTSQTTMQSSSESYDVIRTFRMGGYGMMVAGPMLHFWFNFVSRILPKVDTVTTFKKMFIGQAIFGPIMTSLFFSVNAALQGENSQQIMARLKRDMVPTMINNAIYWPLCDFITFRFVPVHLQPLVNNAFSYVWTIYITYMANLAKAE